MELELLQLEFEEKAEKAMETYKGNLSRIQVGRANPQILSSIKVDYYDVSTPIAQVATISVPEPRQLLIKPFDLSLTKLIVGSINASQLGILAVDEGDKARMTFPMLTTERRKDLVKSLARYTEQARIAVRQARQDANKEIKGSEDLSEDDVKYFEGEVQKWTDKNIKKIDETTKNKEDDLMTI
ncbi:MAG: ribosome recycling factor [Mycoplasmataceae bacterium]|nr:ribosome recycling factor [Mycoplasmataceae bacterium]